MATAFDYSRPKATAERLIARFGKAGAIRRIANSGDDWNPTRTPADHDCTLVVLDYSLRERESTLIGARDRKVLISTEGVTITPVNSDRLVIGGDAYEIIRIMPLEPGYTVLLWEAQATWIGPAAAVAADSAVWASGDNWVWANGDNATWR